MTIITIMNYEIAVWYIVKFVLLKRLISKYKI